MKTIIRSNIDFKLNDKHTVDVLEENIKIGELPIPIHSMLTMFNGYLSDEDIAKVLEQSFKMDRAYSQKRFADITNKFKYILEKTTDQKRDFELFPAVKKETLNFTKMRAIVPEAIGISLTKDCFMKCKYCYAGATYSEIARPEHNLDISLLEKIFTESKKLGISTFNLTGGDPFAREDIFEILEMIKQYNFNFDISTKKLLSDCEIKRLIPLLSEIQISLDSLDDDVQKVLVGKADYSSAMLTVIKKLIDSGIDVTVNTVITSLNIKSIPTLALSLNEIGVKTHVLSPFCNNIYRSNEELFPSIEDYEELDKIISAMDLEMKIGVPTSYKKHNNKEEQLKGMNDKICSAGEDGFAIGPDGNAAVCERLVYDQEYSIGNIKDSSILEIWNSDAIKKYYMPGPDLFKDTQCYDCDSFEYCLTLRGICYVNSIVLHGKPFAPDNICKYYDWKVRII